MQKRSPNASSESERQAQDPAEVVDYIRPVGGDDDGPDLTLEAWVSTTAPPSVQERILCVAGPGGALQICINGGRIVVDNAGGPARGIVGPGGCNNGR